MAQYFNTPSTMLQLSNGDVVKSIEIKKVYVRVVSGLDAMVQRPYTMSVDMASMSGVIDRAASAYARGSSLEPASLAGSVSSFLRPSTAAQGQAYIEGGWHSDRLVFVIWTEVDYGNGAVHNYITQGYTSRCDYSEVLDSSAEGGYRVDFPHDMSFVGNSNSSVSRIAYSTTEGIKESQTLSGATHLLSSPTSSIFDANQLYGLTPAYVFSGLMAANMSDETNTGYYETPTINGVAALNPNMAQNSYRTNVNPVNYVTTTLKSYINAKSNATVSYMGSSVLESAIAATREPQVLANPFFAWLRNSSELLVTPKEFSWNDIKALDPNVNKKIVLIKRKTAAPMPRYGDTGGWLGQDNTTVVATTLVNAIPALALRNMLASIHFSITNDTIDRSFTANPLSNPPFTSFVDNDLNGIQNVNAFLFQLETDLLREITRNGVDVIRLKFFCDINGVTSLKLSINNEQERDFTAATYADSTFIPVIGKRQDFSNLVAGLDTALVTITDGMSTLGGYYHPQTASAIRGV